MSTFTTKEILVVLFVGIGALILGILMATTGAICLSTKTGTPEYIVSLRNTGITIIVLSTLWIALAAWRKLSMK